MGTECQSVEGGFRDTEGLPQLGVCFKKSKEEEGWRRMYLSLEVACLCQAGGRNPGVGALGS